jgi:thiamine pyrophosphate-dependent acetolactate synthase large subunit-like protein
MPLTGQCTISCEYNGQKANVPVLVSSGQYAYSVIGTDWFQRIKFDFNSIFENLKFKQTIESKPCQTTQELPERPLHSLPPPEQIDADQRQR